MMRGYVLAVGLTVGVASLSLASEEAVAQQKMTACHVGQKVLTPSGAPGAVTKIYGQGGCTVADARGLESSWSASMLSPAPGSPATPARSAPKPGNIPANGAYQCTGGAAGNMKLNFSAGNTYSNEQGKKGAYTVRPSGQLEFKSGPWAGFYARTLDGGRVGLTSQADGTFYQMTCDKR